MVKHVDIRTGDILAAKTKANRRINDTLSRKAKFDKINVDMSNYIYTRELPGGIGVILFLGTMFVYIFYLYHSPVLLQVAL